MRSTLLPILASATMFAGGAMGAAPVAAQESGALERARDNLFTGAYDEAIAAIEPVSADGSGDPAAVALHLRILHELGRTREALEIVGGEGGPAPAPALERWKGDLLFAIGEWAAAEAAWNRSVEARARDRHTARLRLGELAFRRGELAEATEIFDEFIGLYNSGDQLDGEALLAVGHAATFLGRETPSLFQDALRVFDEAAARLPSGDPRPRVAVGELFLSKYVAPDAHAEFQAVLAQNPTHPDALLGEAKAFQFDGDSRALQMAESVLETNPNHVGALSLIAELRLQVENFPQAIIAAEDALEANPRSLEAMSVLAAAWFVVDNMEEYAQLRDRVLEINPAWADLFVRVAQIAADTRKYAEAVDLAQEAVTRDSLAWAGHGLLGMNQLRIGRITDGRRNVERAFEGDPYNPWFKNTLDLLDRMDSFATVSSEHFEVVLPADEAEVLGPRVTALAEEAFAAMSARYGAEPPTPIRLEIFPNSNDFSVRTLGIIGLGALGVSFGSTLVMDSPTARDPGEFNWASTLWHEIAHSFHLAISDHNVPRWFSEGLAVREQRVARSRWGFPVSPQYLRLYASGQMPTLSRMNEAFVRPSFPGQVVFGYVQASLAFEWIEERWGFPVIRAMLDGYREGETTDELTRDLLGLSNDALDTEFDGWLRLRYRTEIASTAESAAPAQGDGPLQGNPQPNLEDLLNGLDLETLRSRAAAQPGSFTARLAYGQALVRAEEWDDAEDELRAAQRLFPGYAGPNGPLAGLALVHQARGETAEAANALRALGRLDESSWAVAVEEAELRRQLDDDDGEMAALERAVEMNPFDQDAQRRLGELAMAAEAWETAIAAREAVVALGPVDVAQARYELARAYFAGGRTAEARSAVLRALEIAPSFDAALELLLEIRGGAA